MYQQKAPSYSLMRLESQHPDGSRHLLGWVFQHRNPLVQAIIGKPLGWHLDFNTWRHNAMTERLTHHGKR